jgi:hypothetical protein
VAVLPRPGIENVEVSQLIPSFRAHPSLAGGSYHSDCRSVFRRIVLHSRLGDEKGSSATFSRWPKPQQSCSREGSFRPKTHAHADYASREAIIMLWYLLYPLRGCVLLLPGSPDTLVVLTDFVAGRQRPPHSLPLIPYGGPLRGTAPGPLAM